MVMVMVIVVVVVVVVVGHLCELSHHFAQSKALAETQLRPGCRLVMHSSSTSSTSSSIGARACAGDD